MMNPDMLCINVGMDSDVPLTEQLPILKNAGFGGVFFDWERDLDIGLLVKRAAECGLYLQSLHAPFYGMDDVWHDESGELADKMMRDLTACLDDCTAYGIDLMICHAIIGMDNHSPNEQGLRRLSSLIEYADKKKVRIAFENTEGEEYLAAIFDRFGELPHIGYCYDSGHAMCYNAGRDMLGRYGKYLFSTHLNDNMGQTDPNEITFFDDSHLLPFDGIADWDSIARQLRELDFRGPLTFEFVCKNRPNRHVSDRYEQMRFEDYIGEAYDRAARFRTLFQNL